MYIQADGVNPSVFQPLVGSALRANAGAKIDVRNSSPLTMSMNGASVLDARRVVTINGQYMTLQPGNVYVNFQNLTNVNNNAAKTITIDQNAFGGLNTYDLSGLPTIPTGLDQDLYINKNVMNPTGAITINNHEGSVYVTGEVRGDPVNIFAAGDFTLNSDGWYHLRDPLQYLDFNSLDDEAAGPGADRVTYNTAAEVTTPSNPSKTLAQSIAETNSRIVSQGRISITARFLNINGLIQSGVDSVDMSIAADFVPPNFLTTLTDYADKVANFTPDPEIQNEQPRTPSNIPGVTFGADNIPLDVTWNPQQKAFLVGKIDPDGGEIIIAGQILSTGGGRLKAASGYAAVNIQNATPYPVVLDEIDTTTQRKGKITIIDSDRLQKTEYIVSGQNVEEKVSQGSLQGGHIIYAAPNITVHTDGQINYMPRSGLKYIWVEGQTLSRTIVRIYEKKSFNLVGDNFIADLLVADSSFVKEDIIPRGTPRRLVESEVREVQGTAAVPAYAIDKAYTIDYVQLGDANIRVKPNRTLVRHTPNNRAGIVYRYVGATEKMVDISTVNYGVDPEWRNSGESAETFTADGASDHFESNNQSVKSESKTYGGGWLQEKLVRTKLTIDEGIKDFFTHTLKADYPVAIELTRGAAAPNINISSAGGIRLKGNVQTSTNGAVTLTSTAGSILADDAVAIYAATPTLFASGNIDVQIEGNRGVLNATAGRDMLITAISKDNATSRISVGAIVAVARHSSSLPTASRQPPVALSFLVDALS